MTAGPGPRIYLGFDFGTQRIGVAVGDAVTRAARALGTVKPRDWPEIDRLLGEWQPAACVVGLPLDREGQDQAVTARARAFAAELHQRSGRPVHLCDEGYSSFGARDDLREARQSGALKRRLTVGDKDSAAARRILQQWLDENDNRDTRV